MMKIALITLFIASMLSVGISAAQDDEAKTIVETAVEAGNFNTLVGAVESAGLAETLNGEGPFTVFAPTDEAFAAVEGLDAIDTETLGNILKYHVASGAIMSAELVAMTTIPTLQGENLTVEVTDDGVMVGEANVIAADILCSNGVIHVIDAVLIPPAEETAEELAEDTSPIDTNLSATSSQNAFLDLPVNESLIDTNLSTTASQGAFLDQDVNESLIDASTPGTITQMEFLTGEPVDTPTPFYQKGRMMGSGGSEETSADQPPAFFKKHQMMGT
jgi:uncharacterized surface protein with fasciclin (FAS1) repeats